MGIDGDILTEDMARLPLSFGGLGLSTVQKRHPGVARLIITRLSGERERKGEKEREKEREREREKERERKRRREGEKRKGRRRKGRRRERKKRGRRKGGRQNGRRKKRGRNACIMDDCFFFRHGATRSGRW